MSTIGKKVIVALTGLIMFGFVIGHLLGNLQVFAGAEKINDYAQFLRDNPLILWGTRVVLLVAVFLHIITTISLTRHNRQSRPQAYAQKKNVGSTWASRIMMWSGLLLLIYIVYHLLHLTFGIVHPQFEHHNVYSNMVIGFSVVPVSLFYFAGLLALGYHLYHGVWSVFQTLGLNHPKYNFYRRILATVMAILITLGYMAIPAAVLMKGVK